MNVEFLIHGTLSDGQSSWKDIDTDYCSRFYTPNPYNVVLEAEAIKRNDGSFSSYYTYLRYNNLAAASNRSGSYFGMTVRIDDMICCDVSNMYCLLDTIFNKCIVGTILNLSNNTYVYTCDSFKAKDAVLRDIEGKFANLFGAIFIAGNDFIAIPTSYNRKNGLLNLNINDVTKSTANDTLSSGNKLCVSPYFATKQSERVKLQMAAVQDEANKKIKSVQEECEKQLQLNMQKLEQAKISASSSKTELQKKNELLQKQVDAADEELERVKELYRTKELNTEINTVAIELKEPIIKLAGLMAERFCEVDDPAIKCTQPFNKKNGNKSKASFVSICWKTLGGAFILLALFIIVAWSLGVIGFIGSNDIIKVKDTQTMQLQDSINGLYNSASTKSIGENVSATEKVFTESSGGSQQDVATYNYSNSHIDIVGKSKDDKGLKVNTKYTFRVLDETFHVLGKELQNGIWKVNDTPIENGAYKVTENVGTQLTISYSVNDTVKINRTIKVIQ